MHQFLHLDELPPKEIFPGFTARFVHTAQMTVAHVEIAQGSILPEHHHLHEQVTNVIRGELEMTVAGHTSRCPAGTSIAIPSNTPHSARALTDCYVIDVFHPVREDFR